MTLLAPGAGGFTMGVAPAAAAVASVNMSLGTYHTGTV